MNLKSDDNNCILINVIEKAGYLLAGMFYSEFNPEGVAVVKDDSKALVYKVLLPEDIKKKQVPQTGVNIRLQFERL